ncbi:NADPH-dependent FMN reductase [Microbacterium sp. A93]|uniref:NADPH-dependent FMN reductase n=1 Tax=Microbacterium sp. A93 TaxID=3450716 RepID=UPI003F42E426
MRIGYIVGSLAQNSINRRLAKALEALAPEGVELFEISISELPLYNWDHDADYPAAALDFKDAVSSADGILFVTPEYSRSIPAALKNAIEWGARPWGQAVWGGVPAAVIGTSPGGTGTAMAQQHLRNILAHVDMKTMGQPESFIQSREGAIAETGEVQDGALLQILQGFVEALTAHVEANARVAA